MTTTASQRRRLHPISKQQPGPSSRFKCHHSSLAHRRLVNYSSDPHYLLSKKTAAKLQCLFAGLRLEFRGRVSGQLWPARSRFLCDCNAGIPPYRGPCSCARRWDYGMKGGHMAWMSWVEAKEPGLGFFRRLATSVVFSRTYTIFAPTFVTNRFRPLEKQLFLPSPLRLTFPLHMALQTLGRLRLRLRLHLVLRALFLHFWNDAAQLTRLSPLISLPRHAFHYYVTRRKTLRSIDASCL